MKQKTTAGRGKSLLSLLLVLLMLCSLLPVTALADDAQTYYYNIITNVPQATSAGDLIHPYINPAKGADKVAQTNSSLTSFYVSNMLNIYQKYDIDYVEIDGLKLTLDELKQHTSFYTPDTSSCEHLSGRTVQVKYDPDFKYVFIRLGGPSGEITSDIDIKFIFDVPETAAYTASYTNTENVCAQNTATTESGASEWYVFATKKLDDGTLFGYWTWTSESDPTGNNGEKLTDNLLCVELTEDRTYTAHYLPTLTPVIEIADGYTINITTTNQGLIDTEGTYRWKITNTQPNDYVLSYIEDDAGNKFESTNGKDVTIDVTKDGQVFTAHFLPVLTPDVQIADGYSFNFTKTYKKAVTTESGEYASRWQLGHSLTNLVTLLYVEDDAGNKFESTNGKNVLIDVTKDGQVFTAHFEKKDGLEFPYLQDTASLRMMIGAPQRYNDPYDGHLVLSAGSYDSKHTGASDGHPLGIFFDVAAMLDYSSSSHSFTATYKGDTEPFAEWSKSTFANNTQYTGAKIDLDKLRAAGGVVTVTYTGKTKLGENFSSTKEYTLDLDALDKANINTELKRLDTGSRTLKNIEDVVTVTDSVTGITTIYAVGQTAVFMRDTTASEYTATITNAFSFGNSDAKQTGFAAFAADESGAYAMIMHTIATGYRIDLCRLGDDGAWTMVDGSKFYEGNWNTGNNTFEGGSNKRQNIRGMTIENGKIRVFGDTFDAVWDGTAWTAEAHPDGLVIGCPRTELGNWRYCMMKGVFETDNGFLAASSSGGIWKYANGVWSKLTWSTNEGVNEGLDPNTAFWGISVARNGNFYVKLGDAGYNSPEIYRIETARLTDSTCVKKLSVDTRYVDDFKDCFAGEDYTGKVYVMTKGVGYIRYNSSWQGVYLYSVNMDTGLWTLENIGGDFYDANEGGQNIYPCEIAKIFNPCDKLTVFGAVEGAYELNTLPIGSVDMDTIRTTAKTELADYLESLGEDNYSEGNYAQVIAAYNAGLAAIDAAEDIPGVKSARDAAKAAMKEIKADRQGTKTVWVSFSNDGKFILGNDEDSTVMGAMKVTVDYFDLADYGLDAFYRYDDDGTLIEQPTALHLYIKLLEQYYMANGEKLEPGKTVVGSSELKALLITGSAASMYMKNFWGHDENLTYFVNHQYPLMRPGWGSTADWILLENGDYVELAMYTDWSFYQSSEAGFHYFTDTDGNAVSELTANSGDLIVMRATADMSGGQGTAIGAGKEVYYTAAADMTTDVTTWTKLGTADTTGRISYDFSNLPAGDYYIGVAGSTVNSPAAILVHVEGGQSTIKGDVNGDGEINNFDAALIYAYYNGKAELTSDQLKAADVNGDGAVDNFDAALVYAFYSNKITQFNA